MRNILAKFVDAVKRYQYEVFIGSCIVLVALISYNFGQINSLKKTPVSVKESANLKVDIFDATTNKIQPLTSNPPPLKLDTRVVVSKNSDKYHYSWCSGAKRIKSENQIWFTSAQEAESKGYVLAGNCNL